MNDWYEIRVKGRLDREWMDWFEGLEILYEDDETILKGNIRDQARLYGILNKFSNLNLSLVSVNGHDAPPDMNDPLK